MTQDQYITILFDDLGFNIAQRRDWLERNYGKRFSDELRPSIKSSVIVRLKGMKEKPEDWNDRDAS